jgi:2-oxoglutarate dehydrogenase E2 component (dihydrolipoamide succinyltransferase)
LVKDGDYVEKDQAIAEVDSDKATLELPAEASGIITLKAEEGDAVAVGAVVCLIDTEGAKPEGSDKSEGSTAEVAPAAPVAEAPKRQLHQLRLQQQLPGCDLCFRDTLQLQEKF